MRVRVRVRVSVRTARVTVRVGGVVDPTHDAGAELHREGLTGADDGVAHREARGLLVHLGGSGDGGSVAGRATGDAGVALEWGAPPSSEAGRGLEGGHLNGRHVALEADNLADELGVADAHELVHCRAGHIFGDHNRS